MAQKTQIGIESQLQAAANECTRQGGQLTALRRAVLTLILEAQRPPTAYQLLDRLRETRKSAVPPTIYRALDFLLGMKLIHRVECLNAFIPCTEHNQHTHPVELLICSSCGIVAEVEDQAVSEALLHVTQSHGFHLGSAVVEVEGTCALCAQGG